MIIKSLDGYRIAFSDEFNNKNASFPSISWNTNFFQWGGLRTLQGNQERQIYVDPTYRGSSGQLLGVNPFNVSGGILTIEAKPTSAALKMDLNGMPYTSGLLTSSHIQTYGYFEIRAELPVGKGLWPAFWLVGDGNYGNREIDVFEVLGDDTTRIYQTVHRPNSPKVGTSYYGIDTAKGFHTYGLEWTPDEIVWYVDGATTFRQPNFVDVPMYMLLNLAVGGNWGGNPDQSTVFPAEMRIDYVRAYESILVEPVTRIGTAGSNTLVGSTGADRLSGKAGNDLLIGGMGGDILDGGVGIDTVSYTGSTGAVSVDLQAKVAMGGHAEGDFFVSIENVTGSVFSDRIKGNAQANVIDGGPGSDILIGGGGADTFIVRKGQAGDVIRDFRLNDVVRLEGYELAGFAALEAQMTQEGSDTLLTIDGETLKFLNVQSSSLTAKQFHSQWVPVTSEPGTATVPSHIPVVITINAYGTSVDDCNAHFKLLIDGKEMGEGTAGASANVYTYTAKVSTEHPHKVQVQFVNDIMINGQDRNLYIHDITINGHLVAPGDDNVSYDRGALDDRDVIAGQSAMYWNGTLSVDSDASYFSAVGQYDIM
ncbi:family 16 glycosylhydrolase (plasmid) [Skermanella rosea]|uniref:family 16 glycosylhydrolase n=1 Tax=Skermanella rosea TaxID=1817965 RepID=UPI0019319C80|nr:carbohydrate-binding domain-containing protein [Skermanella rosea]UEM07134.1 family 16 glycosylhydrolase [Skermanella rosea]